MMSFKKSFNLVSYIRCHQQRQIRGDGDTEDRQGAQRHRPDPSTMSLPVIEAPAGKGGAEDVPQRGTDEDHGDAAVVGADAGRMMTIRR